MKDDSRVFPSDELEMRWINFHDMEDEVKKPQEIIHRYKNRSSSLSQRLAEVSLEGCNGLVVRVVGCGERGPGFSPSSLQLFFPSCRLHRL